MADKGSLDWAFEADYLQACSCAYGCPCEFEAPPTEGWCEGTAVWRINRGHYKDVDLAGLTFGAALRFPEAMHKGNGTLVVIVDEQADERQRDALAKITSGEAGGMPFEVFPALVTNLLEPQYVPVETHYDGVDSWVRLGDKVQIKLAPIRNPVTGEPEQIRLEHGTGFIFKGADVTAAEQCQVAIDGLSFSHPDRAGFVTTVSYPMG